jgi:SOS-response transcriptional repressor LexA
MDKEKEEVGPESGKIQVRLNPQEANELRSAKNELEPRLRWADFYKKMIHMGIEAYRDEKAIVEFVKRERGKQDILQILTNNPGLIESPFRSKYKNAETAPLETVSETSPEYLEAAPKFENDVEYLDWEMIMIPCFGKTAAGDPLDISIPPDEYMPFPRQALRGDPADYFYLKIHGYSMVDAGINEGDMVVIRRAEEPVNGEIMLVRHENASTLKKIAIKRGRTYLCWEDGTGKQLLVNSGDFQVQGRLIWITKWPKK